MAGKTLLQLCFWIVLARFCHTTLQTCTDVSCSASCPPSSGTYTLTNANSDSFTVYCLFESGYGYTFIAANTSVDPNLAKLFTEKTEVLIRHKLQNGSQYDATAAQISKYSSENLGVLYNSSTGYNNLVNDHMTPYLYVGFVPKAGVNHSKDIQGWKVQGTDYNFTNCDANPNSYFTLLYNSQNEAYGNYSHPNTDLLRVWYDYASEVNSTDNIPDAFFTDQFEIHFGGCGGFQISTDFPDVAGVTIGLKFILCETPEVIAYGSMSCSGIGEGDTVTYSCNAGYIISSGSVTRECINSQWSGIQPTCAEIVVVCHPNNSIDVFSLHADYYFNAIQNVTNGGPIEKCSISDINSTAVTITGCLKDFPILFTIGPYNGIELYTLHGGKDVVIVQILCNEIPGSGKVHFIDNTYNVGLGVAEHKGITVTPGVTSVLNPTSAVVGDPVAWTISIPSEYILEVTSCEGYPGIDALSNVSISLISSGGCNATSHLITHFSDAYDGTVTATLSAFKFYNYDNVFLYVT